MIPTRPAVVFVGLLLSGISLLVVARAGKESPQGADRSLEHSQDELPINAAPEDQFNFWHGTWRVVNRFLQEDGSWVESGTATDHVMSVLDGKATLELWSGKIRGGMYLPGFSLRYIDQADSTWHVILNWPMPNRPRFGQLRGSFRHNRGEFFRAFTDSTGQTTRVRFTFSDITPTSLRWDNATSSDSGQSWRPRWIMEFTRTGAPVSWPLPPGYMHTMRDGTRCSAPEARRFDVLQGDWKGTLTTAEGSSVPAQLQARRILDGCAVLERFAFGAEQVQRLLRVRSYVPGKDGWVVLHLDDRPGTTAWFQEGAPEPGPLATVERESSEPLRQTTWDVLSADSLIYRTATSTDGGTAWSPEARVVLRPLAK